MIRRLLLLLILMIPIDLYGARNPFLFEDDSIKATMSDRLLMIVIGSSRRLALFGSKIVEAGDMIYQEKVILIEHDYVMTEKNGKIKQYRLGISEDSKR